MKNRVLSGMRPTGNLHLGHLVGALGNWIKFQEEYDTYYMVADWHAVSTAYADNLNLAKLSIEIVAEWIASGLDPEKNNIFIQSAVKEHAELNLLFSMIVPVPWLERCPTYKEQKQELKGKDLSTLGFLGYPVLQAADILIYLAENVPVGIDQLPHIELCREIARRFNNYYGQVFPEPKGILTETAKLLGLDNRKMSKSYKNCIYLSDDEKTISKKVGTMITDPQRIRKDDPGHPDVCNVFSYHKEFSKDEIQDIEQQCKAGKIGCVQCKKNLADKLNSLICPIRKKRNELLQDKTYLNKVIETGNSKACETAGSTMKKVRKAMQLYQSV